MQNTVTVGDRLVTDIMTRKVVAVEPDSWVIDAARIMVDSDVSGLPVVARGKLVGIINETDIVSREIKLRDPLYLSIFDAMITIPRGRSRDEVRRVTSSTVADLMTHPVVSVTSDATVAEVATLMFERRFNPIPVVDEHEKVVGIVSRSDIIRAIVEAADAADEE